MAQGGAEPNPILHHRHRQLLARIEQGHGLKKRHCDKMVNKPETEHHPPHGSPKKRRLTSVNRPVSRALHFDSSMDPFFSTLQQVIRNTVHEEIQELPRFWQFHPLGTQPSNKRYYPRRKLVFANKINKNLYTGEKNVDEYNKPIQIMLIDTNTKEICMDPVSCKEVKIMVLDGDFDQEDWSSEDFNRNVLKPRSGKPLLVGTDTAVLNEGICKLQNLTFTDNSTWVRSRMFRLGVCVSSRYHDAISIGEALSSPFAVKDRHGIVVKKGEQEQRKLNDEVWRLKKIPKYGIYHFRLKAKWINSVQDFLRMMFTSSSELKDILQMPNKDWDEAIRDAMTCLMGDKSYLFKGEGTAIKFNPIGVILEVSIDGESSFYEDLSPQNRDLVDQMASEAYQQWSHLEKVSADSKLTSTWQTCFFSFNHLLGAFGHPSLHQHR